MIAIYLVGALVIVISVTTLLAQGAVLLAGVAAVALFHLGCLLFILAVRIFDPDAGKFMIDWIMRNSRPDPADR